MSKAIKGRFYAVESKARYTSRGRVKRHSSSWWQWHAEVWQGDTLLWSDDCRVPGKLIPALTETLASFRRLQEIGQKFESWNAICERAGKNL